MECIERLLEEEETREQNTEMGQFNRLENRGDNNERKS